MSDDPLHVACGGWDGNMWAEPSLEKAQQLLESGQGRKYLEVKDDRHGWAPLHSAAAYDKSGKIVKLLIQHGAKLEAGDNNDWTPLHCAARNDKSGKIVEVLMQHGANSEPRTYDYHDTPLITASLYNNPSATLVLLRHGANIKAKNRYGDTALHYAFYHGHKEVAEMILNFVVDSSSSLSLGLGQGLEEARNLVMNIRNDDGETALDLAKSESQTEIIQWWETLQPEKNEQQQRLHREQQQRLPATRDTMSKEQASLDPNHPIFKGMKLEELEEFEQELIVQYGSQEVYRTKTMRDIVNDVITPICTKVHKSYAEYLNDKNKGRGVDGRRKKKKADAFVTHCWNEPFYLLVAALRAQFGNSFHSTSFWICSFAIPQGDSQLIQEELSTQLDQCPFVLALKEARQFVVFRNSTTDLYSRIWCVCELVFADKFGKFDEDDGTPNYHPPVVLGDNSKFINSTSSCLDASSSNIDDRERILKFLLTEDGARERIDDLIGRLRKFRGRAVKAELVKEDDVPQQPTPSPRSTSWLTAPLFVRPKDVTDDLDFFISHHGPDTKDTLAGPLHSILEKFGSSSFVDKKSIEPGEPTQVEMARGLYSCRCGVVFISKNFLNSIWCRMELNTLYRRFKKKQEQACNKKDRKFKLLLFFQNEDMINLPEYHELKTIGLIIRPEGMQDRHYVINEVVPRLLQFIGRVASSDLGGEEKTALRHQIAGYLDEYLDDPNVTMQSSLQRKAHLKKKKKKKQGFGSIV